MEEIQEVEVQNVLDIQDVQEPIMNIKELNDILVKNYLVYSIDVVLNRAIVEQLDSLKPVNRSILLAAEVNGLVKSNHFAKSAQIVGTVLGKFHPHGDASAYGALVKMVQPFYTRYPLFIGKGNWGGRSAEPAAAMRYTETMLSPVGKYALDMYVNEGKIPYGEHKLSFNNVNKIPLALPSILPLLLMNGTEGIAVGFASKFPSHNLGDIYDVFDYYIDVLLQKQPFSELKLVKKLKGPDLASGGIIVNCSIDNLSRSYIDGKGSFTVRSKYTIDQETNTINITEIPHGINLSKEVSFVDRSDIFKKLIKGIDDLSDIEHGLNVEIEVKKGVNPNVVLNNLWKYTNFQANINVNLTTISGGLVKRNVSIKDYVHNHIVHSCKLFKIQAVNNLNILLEKEFVLKTKIKIYENIADIISALQSEDPDNNLKTLDFNDCEIKIINDFKLSALRKISKDSSLEALREIEDKKNICNELINNKKALLLRVKKELLYIRDTFGDKRKTELTNINVNLKDIELIKEEQMIILLDEENRIKRSTASAYTSQSRGGKGRKSEAIKLCFNCSNKDKILIFTNLGNCFTILAHHITNNARSIINYLDELKEGEKIIDVKPIRFNDEGIYTSFIATKLGKVKRFDLKDYPKRSNSITSLIDGDEVVSVEIIDPKETKSISIISETHLIKNSISSYRPIGSKLSNGVNANKSKNTIGCYSSDYLALLFSDGKSKIIRTLDFVEKGRNISGVSITKKGCTIKVVIPLTAQNIEDDDIIIYTSSNSIRIPINTLPMPKSNHSLGTKALTLKKGDVILSGVVVQGQKEDEIDKVIEGSIVDNTIEES